MRELEQLPHRERMEVAAKVLDRMGMAAPGRSGSSKTAVMWFNVAWAAVGATLAFWLGIGQLTGRVDLTTEPAGARVSIDGIPWRDISLSPIRLKAGTHTLTVESPGYVRDDQNIVVAAGRTLPVRVKLEGSTDTGFEITSDPAGMEAWLDGAPMRGPAGTALTNFRASRIAPGEHLLELKADAQHLYWRQRVRVEPGEFTRIHATLMPHVADGF